MGVSDVVIQGMPGGAGGMLQEGATEEKGENARLVSICSSLLQYMQYIERMLQLLSALKTCTKATNASPK